jgi:hypothetical protein
MKGCGKRLKRQEVLKILARQKDKFAHNYGVTKLGVFGSVARDEAGEANDVDIVVEMEKPDLFYMVHIKEELEDALQCPVDIVHYRKRMNEFLRNVINEEAIYV